MAHETVVIYDFDCERAECLTCEWSGVWLSVTGADFAWADGQAHEMEMEMEN